MRLINDSFENWKDHDIEPESFDLILTDPPYLKEYLHLWKKLGQVSKTLLKPNGFLVTYSSQAYLPEFLGYLSENLEYVWTLCLTQKRQGVWWPKRFKYKWKPILVFVKPGVGKTDLGRWRSDIIKGGNIEKTYHPWQQSTEEVSTLIKMFSNKNDLILDPFVGTGTSIISSLSTGRRCVGFDIDPEQIDKARERVEGYSMLTGVDINGY